VKAVARGFTLIEMLLVIVIIGVITAVTVPQFVKSMHGNRLRSAARMVIGGGRYARSMAVLHQRAMVVVLDTENSVLKVEQAPSRNSDRLVSGSSDVDADDEEVDESSPLDDIGEKDGERVALGGAEEKAPALERKLDGVEIESVELRGLGEGVSLGDGAVKRIIYESNGRCVPYEVKLVDRAGLSILIKVDALASATTERGDQ
jgi:prepilin-type N-terminal cleavage/methylation domain-containing protein